MNGQKRLLMIFLQLLEGEKVSKQELMKKFGKKESTIQRDIAIIEEVLADSLTEQDSDEMFPILRDGRGNYQLRSHSKLAFDKLTDEEILILLKILYGSRVFNRTEMDQLRHKLLSMADDGDNLKRFLMNEEFYYRGVSVPDLFDRVQLICEAIQENCLIEFSYSKNGSTETLRRLPEAIHFSDMYLYMISDNHLGKDNATLSEMNKFRINNMVDLKKLPISARHKDYKERYEGGVLRNQTGRFSYFGHPITMTVEFYFDPVYVLDRFPDSKIIKQEGHTYTIEMHVNDGYGTKMWLLTQGDMIKVLSPASMREYTINEMIGGLELYGYEIYKDGKQEHVRDLDHD